MLLIGLLIILGIGFLFFIILILVIIYVFLCIQFGFSLVVIIVIIGMVVVFGDVGFLVFDFILGLILGLNMDGQYDYMKDSVILIFIYFNILFMIFGWIVVMVL